MNSQIGRPELKTLSWLGIFRLGLVQTALGAIIVISTSTLNRVMVVELGLAAMLPGVLVALHYAVQISRPQMGHSSDRSRNRTRWIIAGICVLAAGSIGAALSVALMEHSTVAGITAATVAFMCIGFGVGASGTSLLALLASRVDEHRAPAAATVVWIMMIAGFVLTAAIGGAFLDPFSMTRMVTVTAVASLLAVVVAILAVWGVERNTRVARLPEEKPAASNFRQALQQTWQDIEARQFTIFVFISMLAYSAQDLILEPFAGTVFGYTPGESTQLGGLQHGGVLLGMLIVAIIGTRLARRRGATLKPWCVGGCLASAAALAVLAATGWGAVGSALQPAVFFLGLANGVFAVAAIGSMMLLAVKNGNRQRAGIRMGVWGAAQAVAFAAGGFLGTASIDLSNALINDASVAYALVFTLQALLFIYAAALAWRLGSFARPNTSPNTTPGKSLAHGNAPEAHPVPANSGYASHGEWANT